MYYLVHTHIELEIAHAFGYVTYTFQVSPQY